MHNAFEFVGLKTDNKTMSFVRTTSVLCLYSVFQFFTRYGPDFELHITPGNRPDENSKDYLEEIERVILGKHM